MTCGKQIKAEAVIFDKDGTLIEFDAFWVSLSLAAMKAVLQQLNQNEMLLGEILEAFGVHNGETDINSVLCKGTYAQMAEIIHTILEHHGCTISLKELENKVREAYNIHTQAGEVKATCTNLREVLQTLKNKGKKIAVITTDNKQVTLFCLEKLGIADLFDKIYTDDGDIPAKPHPDSAFDFCKTFDICQENIVMVGDTMTDILFAHNSGIGMVAVAKSEKNKQILSKETEIVIHDVSELLEILE